MKSIIGVIGKGFVGTALFEGMKHAFEVLSYDKQKGFESSEKPQLDTDTFILSAADRAYSATIGGTDPYVAFLEEVGTGPIFVCVPTPMNPDGSCNTGIVESVIDEIAQKCLPGTVVCIKSTVPPGTTDRINSKYEHVHVCFNPEFLREVSFIEDFKNQDRIIIGGPHDGTKVLKQVYETAYSGVPVTKTHSTIAEMVKYMTNSFLAVKVGFAAEMLQICRHLEIDYDKVVEYATKDKRLGTSHWSQPGPDGKLGFGGSCFPKDINGLMSLAKQLGVDANVLKGAWATNLKVRPEQDWKELKGRAVNE